MKNVKEIVTDSCSFESLITAGNVIYVDKTAYVAKMVMSRSSFFIISRPRRFGKSLMCSTLDALFSGRKELFKDLYIAKSGYDFKSYPVLRFDFSALECSSYEGFLATFRKQLKNNARNNGFDIEESTPASMIYDLVYEMESPVIIIDEFDSPIIDAVSRGRTELAERMRDDFNAFYKVIKSFTEKVRFLFITGCTKLSGLSIFSAMNNLNDISTDPRYAGMFGYTEDELAKYFSEHIDQKLSLSDGRYCSRAEFLNALRGYYDGYRFSLSKDLRVYNPVSIGKYFSGEDLIFSNYWMTTGGLSTLAVTLARHNNLLSVVEEKPELNIQDLSVFDIMTLSASSLSKRSVLALLYYAGYLTIAGVDGPDLLLDFPNEEVRGTFLSSLIETYGSYDRNPASIANTACKAVNRGDVELLINTLNELYKPLTPMDLRGNRESLIQLLFKALFVIAGVKVMTEVYAGKGRLDALVMAKGHNYIIEFKVDGKTSESAVEQIMEKHYDWLFTGDDTPLHLIGIDFRTEERQIVSYTHQLYASKLIT